MSSLKVTQNYFRIDLRSGEENRRDIIDRLANLNVPESLLYLTVLIDSSSLPQQIMNIPLIIIFKAVMVTGAVLHRQQHRGF